VAENKVILEFVGDVSGLKPAIDTLSQLGNLSEEQVTAFKKANEQFAKASQQANNTEKSVSKLATSFKQVSGAVAGKAIVEPLNQMAKATENATAKTVTLKGQLRALKAELAGLDEGSVEFEKVAQRAAQLEDQIGDVNERVRVLASDTFKFDAAVDAVRGVTAAFSVAQGAAALFGNESEDVQKALLKVQGATALLTGVQEIANQVTGQGAAKLFILNAAQKANAVATNISARAVAFFGQASAAAWATATLGLSVLITAVIALAMNFEKVGKALGFIDEENNKLNSTLQQQLEVQRKLRLEKQNRIKDLQDQLDLEVELLKLSGADPKAIREKEINALQAQRQEKLNKILEITEKIERLTNMGAAKRLAVYNIDAERFEILKKEANEQIKSLEKEEQILEAKTLGLERTKDTNKEVEKSGDVLNNYIKQLQTFYTTLTGAEPTQVEKVAKRAAEIYIATLKRELEKSKPDFAKQLGELLSGKKDVPPIKIPVELQKSINFKKFIDEELPALLVDAGQQISNAFFQILGQNRQAQFEEEQRQLDQRRERELANKNLTESQKAVIDKKYQKQQAELRAKQFRADQQAAIAQAIINGALAVTRIFATAGGALSPAAIASVALTNVATAAQIAVISSQKAPKFAKGGWIGGKPHSQGGTLIEAEKDEFMVRKSVARQNKSFLEAFNKTGNVPKALDLVGFMPSIKDNDLIVMENKTNIDYSKLGRAVAREMSKLPQSELEVNYRGLLTSISGQQSLIEWQKRKYN
jgi:hypothetical protein